MHELEEFTEYLGEYPCKKRHCNIIFTQKSYLFNHEEETHHISHDYFCCIFCPRFDFISKGAVMEHMWSRHAARANYMWDYLAKEMNALPSPEIAAHIRARSGKRFVIDGKENNLPKWFACRWGDCDFVGKDGPELLAHLEHYRLERFLDEVSYLENKVFWACKWHGCAATLTFDAVEGGARGQGTPCTGGFGALDVPDELHGPFLSNGDDEGLDSSLVHVDMPPLSDTATAAGAALHEVNAEETDPQLNSATAPPLRDRLHPKTSQTLSMESRSHLSSASASPALAPVSDKVTAMQDDILQHLHAHIPIRCVFCCFVFTSFTTYDKHKCCVKSKTRRLQVEVEPETSDSSGTATVTTTAAPVGCLASAYTAQMRMRSTPDPSVAVAVEKPLPRPPIKVPGWRARLSKAITERIKHLNKEDTEDNGIEAMAEAVVLARPGTLHEIVMIQRRNEEL